MYLDARELTRDDPTPLRASVAVVGGGVAGIALAAALGRAGVEVIVLESGGRSSAASTDALADGFSQGLPYTVDAHTQARLLGGSSNLWGGWCRPLEPDDLAPRPWVPDSGWPITYEDLAPYYARAHEVLDLGPERWDAAFWAPAVQAAQVRTIELDGGVETSFSQFSGQHRIAERYDAELAGSDRVKVLLHATLVGLDAAGGRVTGLTVATPEGRRLPVAADRVVLAAGGIENPRLLLAAGLGGDHVGRCFADHPRLLIGRVERRAPLHGNRLYDIRTQDRDPAVTGHGRLVAANLVLSPEVRERERLLSARVWLRSQLVADTAPGVGSLRAMRTDRRLRGDNQGRRRHLAGMAADPLGLARFAVGRSVPALRRRTTFEVIGEQRPDPDSRITLADTRDPLGVPRPRLDWRVGDDVGRSLHRTVELVAAALERAGAARTVVPPLPADWRDHVSGTWHPMGATRMAVSPGAGVVDTDCRVHGLANLYLAGSSVFPGYGANFPTMTLTALALRLADHLSR